MNMQILQPPSDRAWDASRNGYINPPAQATLQVLEPYPAVCFEGASLVYQPLNVPVGGPVDPGINHWHAALSPPLYAPVPLSGASSILDTSSDLESYASDFNRSGIHGGESDDESAQVHHLPVHPNGPFDDQGQYYAPVQQPTFPTPSELLSQSPYADIGFGSSPEPFESGSDHHASELEAGITSSRKARRRAIAAAVGAIPTDPDTISSHDKKRHYLECIEQYIVYLHHEFEIRNATPPALRRVESYPGLSNPSIRTLLVHMERTTKKLNMKTSAEEQRFAALCEQVNQVEGDHGPSATM